MVSFSKQSETKRRSEESSSTARLIKYSAITRCWMERTMPIQRTPPTLMKTGTSRSTLLRESSQLSTLPLSWSRCWSSSIWSKYVHHHINSLFDSPFLILSNFCLVVRAMWQNSSKGTDSMDKCLWSSGIRKVSHYYRIWMTCAQMRSSITCIPWSKQLSIWPTRVSCTETSSHQTSCTTGRQRQDCSLTLGYQSWS